MKNLWPTWFPYPVSWLRGFLLCFLMAFPILLSFRTIGRAGALLTYKTGHPGPIILSLTIAMVVPFIFLSYVHHFTINRGRREIGWPANLPSSRSIWEDIPDRKLSIYVAIWFVIVTYFYQAEYLIQNFSPRSSTPQPQPQPPTSPAPNPSKQNVNEELERLKREIKDSNSSR